MNKFLSNPALGVLLAAALSLALGIGVGAASDGHTTAKFQGVKANTGTAIHMKDGNKDMLMVSDDFKIPEAPAPHWQVVDSKGNVYLLQQLKIKDNKYNRKIALPPYVHDVAKVQIWCSFAEALLGEASFPAPIAINTNVNMAEAR